jgi:hypothetical protein
MSLLVLLAAAFAFTGCGSKKAKWTVLAYMDGNNNLDNSQNGTSFVIGDVQEMEKAGSTKNVQIMAMVGSLKTGGNCKYYHIEKFDNELPDSLKSTVIEDLGSKDMSDKQVLTNFIRKGMELYPADRYMLIIDDHGGGWRGACVDEQNGAGDLMSMPSIRLALDTFHFDVIVFHACLMSMVEVGYELKDHADYVVASQFSMPMQSILGAQKWLEILGADPGMDGLAISKEVVNAVYTTSNEKQKDSHMAVTDLTQMDLLAAKIADLGNKLIGETGNNWGEVLDAFSNTHYTQYDDPAFVDLREFCKKILQEPNLQNINLIKNAAQAVVDGINAAVPMTKTNIAGLTRGGLCIHFPYQTQLFDSANYVELAFRSTNWYAFLSKFIQSTGGGGGGDGYMSISSNPTGATIWVNGTNSGSQTPAVLTGAANTYTIKLTLTGYIDWQQDVSITAGETTHVNATLTPQGGGGQTNISGTVTWPGHTLSNFCIALLDTSHGSNIVAATTTPVNPANGQYQFQFTQAAAFETYVEAFDDVNNNGTIDVNEGFGYWDQNGNSQWDDMFNLTPGMTVTNANITMFTVTGEGTAGLKRPK